MRWRPAWAIIIIDGVVKVVPWLIFAASLTFELVARGQSSTPAVLRYQAPNTCPSESELRERLQTVLGGELTERLRTARHAIDWNITLDGDRYQSRIWLRIDAEDEGREDASPAGLRETADENCEALVDAGVLIIALSVDPERAAAFLAADATQANVAAEPPAEDCATSLGCGLHVSLGVAAHLELGLLPAPGLGLAVGGQFDLDRVHVGVWLRHALEDAQRWTQNSMAVSLTTSAWLATAEFGYDLLQAREAALMALVRVETGVFVAATSDAEAIKVEPMLNAGLGLLGRWSPVPQLPIEFVAALQAPLLQNVVRVDGAPVFSQSLISATFALRTRWVF